MAKKAAAESKPAAPQAEEKFVDLMLVAADYVKSCGGAEQAQKSLAEAGQFIARAGGVDQASKALSVLENLRERIGS